MKFNYSFIFGLIYIAFFVGIVVADIGEPRECGPWDSGTVFAVFSGFTIPFILGYIGGLVQGTSKGENNDKQ